MCIRDRGIPTTSALLVSEMGAAKGSGTPSTQKIGNLSLAQIIKIAKIKQTKLLARNLKTAAKEVLGSCVSMGITVEERDPRDIQKDIDEGKYDELLGREDQ